MARIVAVGTQTTCTHGTSLMLDCERCEAEPTHGEPITGCTHGVPFSVSCDTCALPRHPPECPTCHGNDWDEHHNLPCSDTTWKNA